MAALACTALILPLVLAPNVVPAGPWIAVSSMLCFIANIAKHNHMHHATFHRHTWKNSRQDWCKETRMPVHSRLSMAVRLVENAFGLEQLNGPVLHLPAGR